MTKPAHPRGTPDWDQLRSGSYHAGFSLVELMAVITILTILFGATTMIVSGGAGKSHLVATDHLASMVEQARYRALVSRSTVMLAIAEPGGAPDHPNQCALGLLEVEDDWDQIDNSTISGRLLGRWQPLETGMVFLGGGHGSQVNPLDFPKHSVRYSTNQTVKAQVTGIVFNAWGRMTYPAGTTSAVLHLAEGGYPGGEATPERHGRDQRISDTWLKIGRATGRAHEVRP